MKAAIRRLKRGVVAPALCLGESLDDDGGIAAADRDVVQEDAPDAAVPVGKRMDTLEQRMEAREGLQDGQGVEEINAQRKGHAHVFFYFELGGPHLRAVNLDTASAKLPTPSVKLAKELAMDVTDHRDRELYRAVTIVLEGEIIRGLRHAKVVLDLQILLAALEHCLEIFLGREVALDGERLACVLFQHVEPFGVLHGGFGQAAQAP